MRYGVPIDLGLGRAPGTARTSHALRRNLDSDVKAFPRDVVELQHYFREAEPGQGVRAVPGVGLEVPIWILGSSLFGAQLAATLGLPYAFASHFAPAALLQAVETYRSRFEPSAQLSEPYVMVGLNVFAAATVEEARFLRTSAQQSILRLRRGEPGLLPPPVAGFEEGLSPAERQVLDQVQSCSVVGSPGSIRPQIEEFVERTGADEVIITAHIFDHDARLRSFETTAAELSVASSGSFRVADQGRRSTRPECGDETTLPKTAAQGGVESRENDGGSAWGHDEGPWEG